MDSQTKEVESYSVISEVLFSQRRAKPTLCLGKIRQKIFKRSNREATGRGPFIRLIEGLAKDWERLV